MGCFFNKSPAPQIRGDDEQLEQAEINKHQQQQQNNNKSSSWLTPEGSADSGGLLLSALPHQKSVSVRQAGRDIGGKQQQQPGGAQQQQAGDAHNNNTTNPNNNSSTTVSTTKEQQQQTPTASGGLFAFTNKTASTTIIRDQKTQPTEFYPAKCGLESEANRGWYLFLRNLLAGGFREFWFFKVPFFEHIFRRNHHYNLDFSFSEKCAQKRTKIIQILVGKIRWVVFFGLYHQQISKGKCGIGEHQWELKT